MNEHKRESKSPSEATKSKDAELNALIKIVETKLPSCKDDLLHPEVYCNFGKSTFSWYACSVMSIPVLEILNKPKLARIMFGLSCTWFFGMSTASFLFSKEAENYIKLGNEKWTKLSLTEEETSRLSDMLKSKVPDPPALTILGALEVLRTLRKEHREYINGVKSLLDQNGIFSTNPIYKAPEQITNLIIDYHDTYQLTR